MVIMGTETQRGQNLYQTQINLYYKHTSMIFRHLLYVLSLYGSKMIFDCPNNFGRVPIVLNWSILFWLGPNHFGLVQIKLFWGYFLKFGPIPK